MIEQQGTLAQPVEFAGVGLFLGKSVKVRCLPADPDAGVRFIRTDIAGHPSIPASAQAAPRPQRWTSVRSGEAEVRMVEHFLSALNALAIDNMVVEINAEEMPVGDGSSLFLAEAFQRAGIRRQNAVRACRALPHAVGAMEGEAVVMALPPAQPGLTVTYILDYGRHYIKSQTHTAVVAQETYARDLAPARTYVLRPEVDAFIKMGLGRGATPQNTIVLEEDGAPSTPLRFDDECARHKVVDLVGDLFLVGFPISARVIGFKSGHATNLQLVRAIRKAFGEPAEEETP